MLFAAGLLTYDPRVHERQKVGQYGARRKYTWYACHWSCISIMMINVFCFRTFFTCIRNLHYYIQHFLFFLLFLKWFLSCVSYLICCFCPYMHHIVVLYLNKCTHCQAFDFLVVFWAPPTLQNSKMKPSQHRCLMQQRWGKFVNFDWNLCLSRKRYGIKPRLPCSCLATNGLGQWGLWCPFPSEPNAPRFLWEYLHVLLHLTYVA